MLYIRLSLILSFVPSIRHLYLSYYSIGSFSIFLSVLTTAASLGEPHRNSWSLQALFHHQGKDSSLGTKGRFASVISYSYGTLEVAENTIGVGECTFFCLTWNRPGVSHFYYFGEQYLGDTVRLSDIRQERLCASIVS